MGEEWMVQPEGSFVPRSTIIIVTFDQGGIVVSFMDQCFFVRAPDPSAYPSLVYTPAHKNTYGSIPICTF